MSSRHTYLDWAASAPVSRRAGRVYTKTLSIFGNPSSPHTEGRKAKEALEDARMRIARLASVKADAVIFTSGATEANALSLLGQVRARKEKNAHVLYAPSAHASTQGAIQALGEEGVSVEPLVLVNGDIDLAELKKQIRPETVVVAVEVVCGETGTHVKTRDIRRALDSVREGISLHVDASQLPLIGSIELTHLGATTLTLDAQKVGGVRGIGVLIAPRRIPLTPLIYGGGQERGLRPGTESPALAQAFATALEEAHAGSARFAMRATAMRERFLTRIQEAVDGVAVNGGAHHVPHIVNLSFLGRDTDYLAALLDVAGFAVSTRSACATDSEGSVAVRAMHGDAERAKATLRISWGPTTKERELDKCITALITAIRFLDENAI